MALKRINKELNDYIKSPEQDISFGPIGEDYFKFQGTIMGPKDTPYEDGIFFINIDLPKDYPFKPPKFTFTTRIYHPNINFQNSSYGFICCCFIPVGSDWSPALTIAKILISIRNLIAQPYTKEICGDQNIYDEYNKNHEEYVAKARYWTKKYAM
jgi:ubiquitin-conjugating enzyme E2 D/E